MKHFEQLAQHDVHTRVNRKFTFYKGESHPPGFITAVILVLIALLFAPLAQAQFAGGDGSSGNPWIIVNADGLNAIRSDLTAHYKLGSNIDLAIDIPTGIGDYAAAGWLPIGDNINKFQGSFDGGGFKISGLWIERAIDYVGLFGYTIDAVFKNLGIEIGTDGIKGGAYVGGLVGWYEAQNSDINITNCYVIGNVTSTSNYIGGLVGRQYAVSTYTNSIKNCYVIGNIEGNTFVGLLTGTQIVTSNGICIIESCYANGTVSGDYGIGGLVGEQFANSVHAGHTNTIKNCYSTGILNGRRLLGGIVGYQLADGGDNFIENCYTTIKVIGTHDNNGGIVGEQEAKSTDNYILNCYVIGDLSGTDRLGGIVGNQVSTGGTNYIDNNYRYQFATVNSSVIPTTDPNHGKALRHGDVTTPAVDLMLQATYENNGWTFTGPWYWDDSKKFPMLNIGNEEYPFPFYMITYDLDGGGSTRLAVTTQESYVPGAAYLLPDDPDKLGFEFGGWMDISNTIFTSLSATDAGHKEFKARWLNTITIAPTTNGSVLSNTLKASSGEIVTITLAPKSGYEPAYLIVYQTGDVSIVVPVTAVSSTTYTFVMPAFDVTVQAMFSLIPLIPTYPPRITGPASMKLFSGYEATSTGVYTINGTAPVKVEKIAGDELITWNNSTRTLDIAEGLPVGDYEVKIRATNEVSSFTFTFTLTVEERVYYLDAEWSYTGGAVTVTTNTDNPYLSIAGQLITLIINPDPGYELETIYVHQYDNPNVIVPLSGEGNIRTFVMPAFHITVVVVFRPIKRTGIDDIQQVNSLKAYVQDGLLYVSGGVEGSTLRVFNANGTLIKASPNPSEGGEFHTLPGRGVYIVTDGNQIVKVMY